LPKPKVTFQNAPLFVKCLNRYFLGVIQSKSFVVPSEICDKRECMEWTNSYGGLAHASKQASALAGLLQREKLIENI